MVRTYRTRVGVRRTVHEPPGTSSSKFYESTGRKVRTKKR
jgi:hypothetical protein